MIRTKFHAGVIPNSEDWKWIETYTKVIKDIQTVYNLPKTSLENKRGTELKAILMKISSNVLEQDKHELSTLTLSLLKEMKVISWDIKTKKEG